MDDLNPIQQAIYNLIQRFVGRQKIVLEAMLDYYYEPDMWRDGAPRAWSIIHKQYGLKSPLGIWEKDGEKWEYFLHGAGCRLTNLQTHEYLNWDAPNLQRFDRSWFLDWMHWYINDPDHVKGGEDVFNNFPPDREDLRKFVYEILSQIEQAGLIMRSDPYPTGYVINS